MGGGVHPPPPPGYYTLSNSPVQIGLNYTNFKTIYRHSFLGYGLWVMGYGLWYSWNGERANFKNLRFRLTLTPSCENNIRGYPWLE